MTVMAWIIGLALVAFIVVQAAQGAWILSAVLLAGMIYVIATA